jgi:hypothetical protein
VRGIFGRETQMKSASQMTEQELRAAYERIQEQRAKRKVS